MVSIESHRKVCSKQLVVFILLYSILFIINRVVDCRKLESTLPQLNSTGWRTINLEPEISVIKNSRRPAEDRDNHKEENSLAAKSKKLIEWDDDELNDLHHLKDVSTMLSFQNLHGVITPKNDYYKKRPQAEQTEAPRKPSTRFSKLVYHGQVKRSGNMKVIDGIKLYINTHRPVSIHRQAFGASHHNQRALITESPARVNETTSTSTKGTLSDVAQEEPSALSSRWTESRPTKVTKLDADNKFQSVQDSKFSWKPILFVSSRSRRTVGKQVAIKLHPSADGLSAKTEKSKLVRTGSDLKWKPITSEFREPQPAKVKLIKRSNSTTNGKVDEGVVYGKKTPDLLSIKQVASSNIEQPFEEDGIIVANKGDQFEELTGRQREPKSVGDLGSNKVWDNRWTPVETTTVLIGSSLIEQVQATTTPFPTLAAPSNSGANHSEFAQKSASDLNYIYSSQPVSSSQPQQEFNRQPSNSYYSNYVMQPTQQVAEQQPALTGTIIDTTSGQTPEMIIDREPQPVQQSDYSMPQTSASFQPAQAPPVRPAIMPTYADSYYNQPVRTQAPYAAAPQPLPVRQSPTTVAPTREIVRQEHHYHYYNSNQQSERSQSNNNNHQQQQPVREQSQIIRELQPLLITQPIIQQQVSTTTTTTPAPPQQIIREIIKEVPMQTREIQPIQLPRIIIPQTMPQISMSSQPTRELESAYPAYQQGGSVVPSAQRIIRQISSSIPTVSMRAFPGIPQIKLPIPSIQLPLKLAAAPTNQAQVTRQTGAFVMPPMPKKTTTYLTETQEMPSHTTIMHTTQFTPATRTIVYTTDHQTPQIMLK